MTSLNRRKEQLASIYTNKRRQGWSDDDIKKHIERTQQGRLKDDITYADIKQSAQRSRNRRQDFNTAMGQDPESGAFGHKQGTYSVETSEGRRPITSREYDLLTTRGAGVSNRLHNEQVRNYLEGQPDVSYNSPRVILSTERGPHLRASPEFAEKVTEAQDATARDNLNEFNAYMNTTSRLRSQSNLNYYSPTNKVKETGLYTPMQTQASVDGKRVAYSYDVALAHGPRPEFILTPKEKYKRWSADVAQNVSYNVGTTLKVGGKRPDTDFFRGTVEKTLTGAADHPVKTGLTFATFAVLPTALRGAGKLFKVSSIVARFPKITAGVAKTVKIGLPVVYAGSVVYRTSLPATKYEKGSALGTIISTEAAPMAAGTYAGTQGLMRGSNYIKTLGRKELPRDVVVLGDNYPSAPVSKHIKIFESGKHNLPNRSRPMVYHATAEKFSPLVEAGRSELSGLYVASGVSTKFLRINNVPSLYGGGFFDPVPSPQVVASTPRGIRAGRTRRVNGRHEWTSEPVEGVVDVPMIKTEVEGLYRPPTRFERLPSEYYFKEKGVRVPINEFKPSAGGAYELTPEGNFRHVRTGKISSSQGGSSAYLSTPSSILGSSLQSFASLRVSSGSMSRSYNPPSRPNISSRTSRASSSRSILSSSSSIAGFSGFSSSSYSTSYRPAGSSSGIYSPSASSLSSSRTLSYKTPKTPARPSGFRFNSHPIRPRSGKPRKIKTIQPKDYTPTARAAIFEITGTPTQMSIKSGLGARPITKKPRGI